MDQKEIYFQRLHNDLGRKLNIDPEIIRYIRNTMIGMSWTKEQIIQHLSQKIAYRTQTQSEYTSVLAKADAKLREKRRINRNKYGRVKYSSDNLDRNLQLYHKTLDAVLKLSPTTMNQILVKTEMDRDKK